MTAKATGSNYERRCRDLLLAREYVVDRARPSLFWKNGHPISFANDFFGVFDFVALHAADPVLLVQVTALSHASDRRNKVAASQVARLFSGGDQKFEIQVWSFGKSVRLGYHFSIMEMFRNVGMLEPDWKIVGTYRYDGTLIPRDGCQCTSCAADFWGDPDVRTRYEAITSKGADS